MPQGTCIETGLHCDEARVCAYGNVYAHPERFLNKPIARTYSQLGYIPLYTICAAATCVMCLFTTPMGGVNKSCEGIIETKRE